MVMTIAQQIDALSAKIFARDIVLYTLVKTILGERTADVVKEQLAEYDAVIEVAVVHE